MNSNWNAPSPSPWQRAATRSSCLLCNAKSRLLPPPHCSWALRRCCGCLRREAAGRTTLAHFHSSPHYVRAFVGTPWSPPPSPLLRGRRRQPAVPSAAPSAALPRAKWSARSVAKAAATRRPRKRAATSAKVARPRYATAATTAGATPTHRA
ncbi:unnamed protein product [Ixodes hexagonus]